MDFMDKMEVNFIAPKNDGTVELRVFVPGELRKQFKGKCATQGKTMSEVISAMMQKYVVDAITLEMLEAEDKE